MGKKTSEKCKSLPPKTSYSAQSFFSNLTFSFARRYIRFFGRAENPRLSKILHVDDKSLQLPGLSEDFYKFYQSKRQSLGLLSVAIRFFLGDFVVLFAFALLEVLSRVSRPYFFSLVLNVLAAPNMAPLDRLYPCLGMFAAMAVLSICSNQVWYRGPAIARRLNSVLSFLIYQRIVKSAAVSQDLANSSTHLIADGLASISNWPIYVCQVVLIPVELVISIALLKHLIHGSLVVMLFALLVLFGLQFIFLVLARSKKRQLEEEKAKFPALIKDPVNGIQVIKYYAWEPIFIEQLRSSTRHFFALLNSHSGYYSLMLGLFFAVPAILGGLSIVLSDEKLMRESTKNSAPVMMTIVAIVFNLFLFTPKCAMGILSVLDTMKNVLKLMGDLERQLPVQLPQPESAENAIESADAVLARDSSFSLQLGSLSVRSGGELVAVIGANGSGKSTLLLSLLRGVALSSGKLRVLASAAYAPQQPWIVSGSVRENVLLGRPHDRDRYRLALALCCLEQDLQSWPQGDRSQVGENGALLSGGQRARLSMARALYGEADLYLLDDIFSALDGRIQQQIAANLRSHVRSVGKTAVVTTNQFNLLPLFTQILLLDGGRLVFNGSYEELQQLDFDFVLHNLERKEEVQSSEQKLEAKQSPDVQQFTCSTENLTGLHEEEAEETDPSETASNSVRKYVGFVFNFVRLLYRGRTIAALPVIFISAASYYPLYLAQVNIFSFFNDDRHFFLGAILSIGLPIVSSMTKVYSSTLGIRIAARNIFVQAVEAVFGTHFRYFSTVSPTEILSIFTTDVITLTETFIEYFVENCELGFLITTILGFVYFCAPYLLSIAPASFFLIRLLMIRYSASSKALAKLGPISKGEVMCHLSNTTAGLVSIRSLGVENIFECYMALKLRRNYALTEVEKGCFSWLAFNIDLISLTNILFFLMYFCLWGKKDRSIERLGVAIFAASNLLSTIQIFVISSSVMASMLNVAMRLVDLTKLPQEETAGEPPPKVSPCWPETGHLELVQVSATLPGTDRLILSGISLSIRPRERIAVIGRTGAGKSSLLNALLRIIDVEGRILLDGVDISSVPIRLLRQRIAIVPQEPYLFAQPIRFNLDPEGTHSDEQLWEVLGRVDLRRKVAAFPDALDASVSKELTESDRQLVSLGRVLLKQPRVVIFDEASAKLDPETGRRVMRLAEEALSGSVLISILHRVETALHYDRIVVMEQGRVVECDAPYTLLCNPQSIFTALLHAKSDSARVFERWFQEAKRAFEERPAGQ